MNSSETASSAGPEAGKPRAQAAVPTYNGRAALKPSVYGWTVALYIFVGGLAAAAQILATAADLLNLPGGSGTVLAGRVIALAGAVTGGGLLVMDLHTRRRFHNMLRIFRPTSPMSIGTYVLMTFGLWSAVALSGQLAGLHWLAVLGGVISSVAGWWMASYTAALLAATSTPLWAASPRLLAVRFAAAAFASGAAALCLVALWTAPALALARALGNVALVSLVVELAGYHAARPVYRARGVDGSLNAWPWNWLHRAGVQVMGGAVPVALYLWVDVGGGHPYLAAAVASLLVLAGGLWMRIVVLLAGNASARRPQDYFRFARATDSQAQGE